MIQGIPLTVYPVTDLDRARSFYTALLGVQPYADAPYYVGYRVGDQEIGLDPNGDVAAGPRTYLRADDAEASVGTAVGSGAEGLQEVTDVGGGKLIASVRDPDGNPIWLVQEPA